MKTASNYHREFVTHGTHGMNMVGETVYGLFPYQQQVWQSETDERDEQRYEGAWPVTIWLTAEDYRDGFGWRRAILERMVKILKHYDHDVDIQAVLVIVPDEKTFLKLETNGLFVLWHGDEPPQML